MNELIQVTAQYSNAVLLVLLPFIGDFVKRTELGVPLPITIQQVQQFKCDPRKGHVGGSVLLTNGFRFVFDDGHVALFESPKAYSFLQDPERIPEFYGPVNIDEATALAIARKALLSLEGRAIADLVNQRPKVISPPSVEGNLVPRYQFQWMMPGPGQWP